MAAIPPRPTLTNPHHWARRSGPARRVTTLLMALCTIVTSTLLFLPGVAHADAGFGVGLVNIATDGFTHPWMGGYVTDIGTAFCIETANGFPRATGNTPSQDLPASRGVSPQDRNALAYALWAFDGTTHDTLAAGLAVVAHGLSGDRRASVQVPQIAVSDPEVYANAVAIYNEAEHRAFWVSDPAVNPWKITTVLTHGDGMTWHAHTSVTTSHGQAIPNNLIEVTPTNVVESPGVTHPRMTDSTGQVDTTWTQADRFTPVAIDVQTAAPTYYRVWKGPDYPGGMVPQRIVTSTGTTYEGRTEATLPTGSAKVLKTTANPAYQSARGATYAVTAAGSDTVRGSLTVGPDGSTNVIELPIGPYTVTETSAPAGVVVDSTPHNVIVAAGRTAELHLSDPVEHNASLALTKVDAATGDPVAGATLVVSRDTDGDGTYETTVGTYRTKTTPTAVDHLVAGRYRITETVAPKGYLPPDEPSQDVTLAWNQSVSVTFTDDRVPPPTTTAIAPPTTAPPTTVTPPTTTSIAPPTTTVTPPTTTVTPPPPPAPPTHGSGGTSPPTGHLPLTGLATQTLGMIAMAFCGVGLVLFAAERRGHRARR